MSSSAKISIITVVKNGGCCLEETILSVLKQKKQHAIDYLIIDGGSTDGTLEIIQQYAEQLAYWVSEPDSGIYDAMNKGWSVAANDSFILFLGAGDRVISLPESMGCYSPFNVVYGTVMMGENTIFNPRADFHLKLYNTLHHQALLVNKTFHSEPPFCCCFRLYADFDFNQRLMKNSANFVFSPELIGYARPDGVSDHQCFSESLKVIYRNFGLLWASLAFAGYYVMRIVPSLKRLRPFQTIKAERNE